ncbi:MAG: hypothetical protein AB7G13_10380 [Lautropia sp.]
MSDAWPWLSFAGLGAFHGLNPAMGWLFAVALGLHRQSRTVVAVSLLPIAAGHLASVAIVAGLLIVLGTLVPADLIRIASGTLLLAWAFYHWRYGHRHRVRFGMQVGLLGLGVWSFLMATAHGAGIMLMPALMQTCLGGTAFDAEGPLPAALAGIGVHTLAMAATSVIVAGIVYQWLGVAVLRRAWLNVDLLWTGALAATGLVLLATALVW